MIIRPIKKTDFDAFEKLAHTSSLGITNLPKNRDLLKKKIEKSLAAFAKETHVPEDEQYLFVLENPETGDIGGTCGLLSRTAMSKPIYFYRIETIHLKHDPKEIQILRAVSYKKAPSELAGLYLHPDYRKGGLGKLLSLSRFLFIAAFQARFDDSFFAEIRGVIGDDNVSPFWEAVGRHFLNLNYHELMKLLETGREFIPDVLPKYPIYLQLLPKHIQAMIGKPHEKSQAALNMLQAEGFQFLGEIDIFEAGPRVVAKTSEIKTVTTSVTGVVVILEKEIVSGKYMIGNERLDFRATIGSLKVVSETTIGITTKTAQALNVQVGDTVRYIMI